MAIFNLASHLRTWRTAAALFVTLLGSARAKDVPTGGLSRTRVELERLARQDDGSASDENLAVLRRIRELLRDAAGAAVSGGDDSDDAWDLLESTWRRRERNAAMEAALALIDAPLDEGVRRLLDSTADADVAVRRHALRTLASRSRDLSSAAEEAIAALREERDPESAAVLVGLVGSLGTLEAARAVLARVPPPPQDATSTRRLRERESTARLREAILDELESMGSSRRPEVRDWLSAGCFREARTPGSLCVAAEAAGRRRDARARSALEDLAAHESEAVALAALGGLVRLGVEPSRRPIESLLTREALSPRVATHAVLALSDLDGEAGVRRLLELSRRDDWTMRAEAAAALSRFPEYDVAFLRVLKLLEDPNREVRARAFDALRSFRRKEAVPAVIGHLAPLGSRDADRALGYLEWATGQRLGGDRAAWTAWWKAARGDFRFAAEERP